jgi:hypothetical protein
MLSATFLSSLTFLKVHLNVASRKQLHIYDAHRLSNCSESDDGPLDSSSAQSQAALLEWQVTVDHIGPHIRPHTLNHSFVCNVAGLKMAVLIIAPLCQFPTMAGCHLPDMGLRQLAREATLQALGHCLNQLSSLPFRFLDLSQEFLSTQTSLHL